MCEKDSRSGGLFRPFDGICDDLEKGVDPDAGTGILDIPIQELDDAPEQDVGDTEESE